MSRKTIKPAQAPAISPEITNCLEGTTLHLGDGRSLEFGESATVSMTLAKALRESGQAK